MVKTVKLLEDPDIKMAKDQLDMLNDVRCRLHWPAVPPVRG